MLTRTLLLALPLALLANVADLRADDENPIVTFVKSKVKNSDEPFSMTVTFKVRPGGEKAFEQAFVSCLTNTRKESGCLAYYLNRSVDDPSSFVMFERFKRIAALESHAKMPHVGELLKTIGPLLDGAPTVSVYGVAGE